jgi:hypothetical protein
MGERHHNGSVGQSIAHQEFCVVNDRHGVHNVEIEIAADPIGEVRRMFCKYRWNVPPERNDQPGSLHLNLNLQERRASRSENLGCLSVDKSG